MASAQCIVMVSTSGDARHVPNNVLEIFFLHRVGVRAGLSVLSLLSERWLSGLKQQLARVAIR